jgi:glutamine synthetase
VPNSDDNLNKSCYDVKRMFDAWPFLDTMVTYMQELGWDVYSFDHEDGQSQFEFDFKYDEALTTADRYIFWRFMAKKVAADLGMVATFMPKPFAHMTGNGAHFNMSLAMPAPAKTCSKPMQTRAAADSRNWDTISLVA